MARPLPLVGTFANANVDLLASVRFLCLRHDAGPSRHNVWQLLEHDGAVLSDEMRQGQSGQLALTTLRHVVELMPTKNRASPESA